MVLAQAEPLGCSDTGMQGWCWLRLSHKVPLGCSESHCWFAQHRAVLSAGAVLSTAVWHWGAPLCTDARSKEGAFGGETAVVKLIAWIEAEGPDWVARME